MSKAIIPAGNVWDFAKVRPRIVRYVSGVHMALSHKGLKLAANKLGLKPQSLDRGEVIVFMNAGQTAFKMLAANNVIVYYRHPKEHRIDPRVIARIPLVFDGKQIDMDRAVKQVLEAEFPRG